MTATLKTGIVQEPSSSIANLTLSSSGGVTFGAAATTNTITSAASTALTIQSAGTTAMTIDTSQNVGIGTTSPSTYGPFVVSNAQNAGIFGVSSNTGGYSYLQLLNTGTSGRSWQLATGGSSSAYAGALAFYDATASSERMRIDSSGNVGIGTTSTSVFKLSVNGTANFSSQLAAVGSPSVSTQGAWIGWNFSGLAGETNIINQNGGGGGGITFSQSTTANVRTEWGRFDSSGNLLVGTTTSIGGKIASTTNAGFSPSGSDNWKKGAFSSNGGFGGPLSFINSGGASDGFCFYLTGTPSQLNIQFGANGGGLSYGVYLTSTGTSWTASSDERLKDISGTITNAVQSVSSLRPIRYTFKADESKTQRVGLIAQDVQKVLPEVVDENADGYFGVRYAEVIPLLVAAIQELSAKVDAQAAEITALQAKVGA